MTAPNPQGPWTTPTAAYTFPEMVVGNPAYVSGTYCYAAKEHTEFAVSSTPSQITITYACNNSFSTVVNNMNLYVPKAVKISIP